MSLIEQWRAVPLATVAADLGHQRVRGRADRMTPCPACGHEGDAVRVYRARAGERWHCHGCQAGGDAVDLVAYRLTDEAYHGQSAVADYYRQHTGEATPATEWAPPPGDYPPSSEVMDLLSACRTATADEHVAAWLSHRGIPAADLPVGALGSMHRPGPAWARWAGQPWPEVGYRAVAPAVTADGVVRSVRCRRVWNHVSGPKTLPPCPVGDRRYRASGLMLATRDGRAALRGGLDGRRVVIVEGEPAWLAWACARPSEVVLGMVSGSWDAEWATAVRRAASVLVVTDHDDAGQRYYERIAADVPCERWRGDKDRPD